MPTKKLPILINVKSDSPEMFQLVFGVIVERLRLGAEKSLEEIAAFVDILVPALKRIERGQQLASPFAQQRFAEAFGMPHGAEVLRNRISLVHALCKQAAKTVAPHAELLFDRELVVYFACAVERKRGWK